MDVTTTKHDALEYSIADLVAIAYRRGMEGGSIDGELVAGEEPGVEPDASEENPSVRNTLANQSVRVVGERQAPPPVDRRRPAGPHVSNRSAIPLAAGHGTMAKR